MKIEFDSAVFKGLKILSLEKGNQAHSFICETLNHGLKPFYVVVMYLFDEYNGTKSFDTIEQANEWSTEWVNP